MNTHNYKLSVGGIIVNVSKKTKLKNIYIRVLPPDGEVTVSAPIDCSDSEIEIIILKKLPQINQSIYNFKNQPRQSKREYVSGESLYLWGQKYMLDVNVGYTKKSVVKTNKKIILNIPEECSLKSKEKIITEWYREEIKNTLPRTIKRCEKLTGLSAKEYRVKNMKTKWGSCNINDKRIWINLQLAKKPVECLEYVMIHELCHLVERNHNNRFYQLVNGYYPNWEDTKKTLDEMPLDYYN